MAAEAIYHHDCQVRFHDGRQLGISNKGRPSGSVDSSKNDTFQQLCDHIDTNEINQYTINDLENCLMGFSDDAFSSAYFNEYAFNFFSGWKSGVMDFWNKIENKL